MAGLGRYSSSSLHPHHALTLSCGALGPNAPHHVTKPSTSVPRGYQSLVHGDVEWPPIRSRVSRRSRTKSVGFSRAGNASARSVRVSKVRGGKTYASDELAALTARHQSVRTELASTTLALEQAHANEHTTKLRTRALEQGLALAQNDAEWAHTELTREREAHATTRADLYSRAAQAEAAREMAEQERTSAAAQLAQAERLLTEAQTRHADAIHTNSELRMRLSSQERDAQLAKSAADQAIELSEARVQRAEQRAMELESSCDALMAECAARERDARAEADEAIADRERLEQDVVSLQEALDRMARALGVEDASDDGLMMPSRAASLAAQVRHEGKRFSDVYIDAARTEEALRRESEERARLEGVLTEVMADLDAHAPQLKAQRAEAAHRPPAISRTSFLRSSSRSARWLSCVRKTSDSSRLRASLASSLRPASRATTSSKRLPTCLSASRANSRQSARHCMMLAASVTCIAMCVLPRVSKLVTQRLKHPSPLSHHSLPPCSPTYSARRQRALPPRSAFTCCKRQPSSTRHASLKQPHRPRIFKLPWTAAMLL